MPIFAMSSFSIKEITGPIAFSLADAEGVVHRVELGFPAEFAVADLPARVRPAFGLDAVETVGLQWDDADAGEWERFGAELVRNNVRLLNVAVDVGDLMTATPDERAATEAELTRWIQRCAGIGAERMRVNLGSPLAAGTQQRPGDELIASVSRLADEASARGLRLLVENHGGPTSDPGWMLALIDAVGAERCGMLLDLGNFDTLTIPGLHVMVGLEPGGDAPDLDDVYARIARFAPRAELVHVKVTAIEEDGSLAPVDLEKALGLLHDAGYDGPLTIEYEGSGRDPWEASGRVLDAARAAWELAARS